jgi:hypothetical protein
MALSARITRAEKFLPSGDVVPGRLPEEIFRAIDNGEVVDESTLTPGQQLTLRDAAAMAATVPRFEGSIDDAKRRAD